MICIFVILNSVTCIVVWHGWQLGAVESVAFTCIIGLSVDYVVHFAAKYSYSPYMSRKDKMGYAYKHVGISILFSTITSFGSSIPLLICMLPMFLKYGVFMACTVFFSFMTANLLFGALSHVIGSQGDSGKGHCCKNICCDKCKL